jgi:hypothetical protein
MRQQRLVWLLIGALLTSVCSPKPDHAAEDLARTMVAQTSIAANAEAIPTNTPPPTPTSPPSATPRPSATTTPTPGPVVFHDDFSTNNGYWRDCRGCQWEGGALVMGPYAPGLLPQDMATVCVPCGTPLYFRMSVRVTHVEGQTDRGFGMLYASTDQDLSFYEISPLFLITVAVRYDRATRVFTWLNPNAQQVMTGLVRPGKATNLLELIVQPAGVGTADMFFRVNDKTAFVLYNKPVEPGEVGLEVDSHAVQVAFDDFEFEEFADE